MAIPVAVTGGTLNYVNQVGGVRRIDLIVRQPSIGSKSGEQGVHIAALPCPRINDSGMTKSWLALDVLAKGAAALATGRAFQAAREQNKIARRYYELAKRQWDFYAKHYIPLELKEIDEINRTRKYKPDYNTAIRGHDCANAVFDSMSDHRDKLYNEFCICPDESTNHLFELALSTVRGDSHNFARRYAEAHADKLDDIRWNRKLQVATRGRGLLPQSSEFANKAAGMFGQYSNAMSGFAGQAMRFSGYISNRRRTQYNGWHDQRVEHRLTDRARTQTGFDYDLNDVYTANGYRPTYYRDSLGDTGNGFYSDAMNSLGQGDVLYDNTHSVQHGFATDSVVGSHA